MRKTLNFVVYRGDRMQYCLKPHDNLEIIKRSFKGFKEGEPPANVHQDEYRRLRIIDRNGITVLIMHQLKDNYFERMAIGIPAIKL